MTEEDDSSIVSSLEDDSIDFKKGKFELYNELISQLKWRFERFLSMKVLMNKFEKLDDSY